jgi:arginyl-tRNA synthetase
MAVPILSGRKLGDVSNVPSKATSRHNRLKFYLYKIGIYLIKKKPKLILLVFCFTLSLHPNFKNMKIEEKLTGSITEAIQSLYGQEVPTALIQLQKTKKEFDGHLTLVVFPFLKISKKKPEQTAQEIGEYLVAHQPAVEAFNVIKGFLNLTIASSEWIKMLADINQQPQFGFQPVTEKSPLVMIEYSSPNTNKPLHLGHVRNNLLGSSLANIMQANGNKVVKTNIVNDRGIHICKSMLAWLKWGNGETPASAGKKGDHLIGDYYVAFDKHYKAEIEELMQQGMSKEEAEANAPLIKEAHEMLVKWEAGDPEVRALWEKMNSWVYAGFDETYKRMGVSFDKIYYESNTYIDGKKKVLEGLEKGLFYQKDDGSVWADLTAEGLDHKLLLRSDGTSVYMTQDIGTAQQRFNDYPIDQMIYVVGNEQNYHFQVLSILLDKLGFKWGKDLIHFSYGMVELPNGKMKSREGTVVDADDLMDEMVATAQETSQELGKLDGLTSEEAAEIARIVGMGALKYFILKVDARKNMTFNPQESIDFNGNTGPFIQYTYARIRSVLRKAEEAGLQIPADLKMDIQLNEKEESLIQHLADFPATIAEAAKGYSPSDIANYTYDLVKEFNQFYHDFSILREENEQLKLFRLALSANVAKVIRLAMSLLGIEVPERM